MDEESHGVTLSFFEMGRLKKPAMHLLIQSTSKCKLLWLRKHKRCQL
jgi:hypothetical protein